jgi:hypothetical protein
MKLLLNVAAEALRRQGSAVLRALSEMPFCAYPDAPGA